MRAIRGRQLARQGPGSEGHVVADFVPDEWLRPVGQIRDEHFRPDRSGRHGPTIVVDDFENRPVGIDVQRPQSRQVSASCRHSPVP